MIQARFWRLAVVASALLLVVVLAGGIWLVITKPRAAVDGAVAVTIGDGTCDPASLTVPAGRVTFAITNAGDRVLEWEILDGVMVVDERENIAPGFTQRLTTRLDPGGYDITCGLVGSPKGRLTVTASDTVAAARPSLIDLLGPLAEYRVYLVGELDALVDDTARLAVAVHAGDLAGAQALYAPVRVHYERIAPIAKLFGDLDTAIDVHAEDLPRREADPAFSGFHRLEYLLFAQKTLAGAAPVADRLAADVRDLADRLKGMTVPPERMAGAAAALLQNAAARTLPGAEDRTDGAALDSFRANIDGARKIADLLRPLTAKADPALADRIAAGFADVDAVLAKYAADNATLADADRTALAAPVATLGDDLAAMRGALGLD